MAKLDPTQQDQLKDIGAYLYQIRQDQARTLDDISLQTFIRPTLLRAIESGDDEPLPEPVFIQGFIRRYAEALGLDGKEISQHFSPHTQVVPPPTETDSDSSNGATPSSLPPKSIAPSISLRSPEPGVNLKPLLMGGVAIAIIIGAILGLIQLLQGRQAEQTVRSTEPSTESTPPPAPTPTPSPVASKPLPPEAPITVDMDLTDRSWLRVTADGEVTFEGTLESGEQRTWTAKTELSIRAGNAGVVMLSLNGGDETPAGDVGQAETVTFTASESGSTDPSSAGTP